MQSATGDASGGPFGLGCSRAEIFVTTSANVTDAPTQLDTAATTLNEFAWDADFTSPNGVRAHPGVYATVGSVIVFSAPVPRARRRPGVSCLWAAGECRWHQRPGGRVAAGGRRMRSARALSFLHMT